MPAAPAAGSLAAGVAVLRGQLKLLPAGPGVYRMIDRAGDVLYVGKARNLKKRVTNYAAVAKLDERLRRMVAETAALEIVSTHTEVEALLLESNLIKRLKPRYNIVMRDDKSFPYILITGDHDWPQIKKYRGARSEKGTYFGPFASAGAVNRTLGALQRAFLLRSCTDAVFAARTRPCLLYQIKRCSAPCVGRIGAADYAALVQQASDFLAGRSQDIQRDLAERMEAASAALEFEKAAIYRDRIRALSQIQAHQDVNPEGLTDADVIAAHQAGGQTSIQVFFFRGGRNYGNRAYFPRHGKDASAPDVLGAFIGQFYDNKLPPPVILLSHPIAETELIAEALGQKAGRRVELLAPRRGGKRKLVEHALRNAEEALARRVSESASQRRLLERLADAFGLDGVPERIEVYDNSHISGTNALGAMIVAGPEGFMKNAYRKFTIRTARAPGAEGDGEGSAAVGGGEEGITPGDDYGMMREVLGRRFARALKEDPERERGAWPDLVILDGGKGQLNAALAVLADLGVDDVPLVAIAKGPDRDAGRERFFLPDGRAMSFEPNDPVLYYLQRLRDEAHRFAIGGHRGKRSKAIGRSILDEIPGIGARRKRALLHHFGSARAVARAGLEDLASVEGISQTVAKKIYDHFNSDS
ncbi:MAG TPA: excinuclease ABC subunit UvrC [Alphaproteobacteria bacterium]|nr:excinuclease ABC subunit UvrC [Alphaproteobacteria bacterium]